MRTEPGFPSGGDPVRAETGPEKERVLAALRIYHQERNQNTPLHLELAKLIEEAKRLAAEAVPYFEERLYNGADPLERGTVKVGEMGYQIWVYGLNSKKQETGYYGDDFETVLQNKNYEEKYGKDPRFVQFRKKIGEVMLALRRVEAALESQRERIFRETLVALGRGTLVGEGEVRSHKEGLYSLKGKAFLAFLERREIIPGDTLSNVSQFRSDSYEFQEIVKESKKRLDITDAEIARIEKIEWSEADKDKLGRLVKATGVYREGLPTIRPQKTASYEYTDEQYVLSLGLDVSAYARTAYEKLGLPPQHRERVLQELSSTGNIEI
jgi:hypothetical protein